MTAVDWNGQRALTRGRVLQWFRSPLGAILVQAERAHLQGCLPGTYSPVAVQIGALPGLDVLETIPAAVRVVLDRPTQCGPEAAQVLGEEVALPFGAASVDVFVLPHALEFCADPHRLLREVAAAVVPHGHVVILGFNPYSLWGLRRLFSGWRGAAPWSGSFLGMSRLQDWLALLEFDVVAGTSLFYRPPFAQERLRDALSFMESAGARWWPGLAAVYAIVARKRTLGVTAVGRPAGVRKRVRPRLAPVSGRLTVRSEAPRTGASRKASGATVRSAPSA